MTLTRIGIAANIVVFIIVILRIYIPVLWWKIRHRGNVAEIFSESEKRFRRIILASIIITIMVPYVFTMFVLITSMQGDNLDD